MPRSFSDGPVVVGGVGGSGTRVVAELLRSLGIFMGDDLNHANDNMRLAGMFTTFQSLIPGLPTADVDLDDILDAFERDMHAAYLAQTDRRLGWGWKVPANFFILPQLARRYGAFRYIHVMRHGLDMVFSDNQNQVRNFGRHYGIDPGLPPAAAALRYWIRANETALADGRRHGIRLLPLSYDRLCAEPGPAIDDLLRFLGRDAGDRDRLVALVRPPESIGRHRRERLDFVTDEDRAAIRALGFDVA